MQLSPNILSTFVTLLVTIGPIESAVVFASLTAGTHRGERRSLAIRSTAIAGLVLLLFAVAGNLTLGLLHISLPAFRVAGGLLLFLQALSLTFSGPGLSSISEGERKDAERPGDIAVFPLAFPVNQRFAVPPLGGGFPRLSRADRRRTPTPIHNQPVYAETIEHWGSYWPSPGRRCAPMPMRTARKFGT